MEAPNVFDPALFATRFIASGLASLSRTSDLAEEKGHAKLKAAAKRHSHTHSHTHSQRAAPH